MGKSWSLMKKELENKMICDSLKGRIKYFATAYREAHDSEGGVAILLDEKEIFRSNFADRINIWYPLAANRNKSWDELNIETLFKGGIENTNFYNAYYQYTNQSIDKSLSSENSIVRLFAILDKRVGKRTLLKLVEEIGNQPKWLQQFYKLRFETENIKYE